MAERDKRVQRRVHRCARLGLAVLELLVGVGCDTSTMGHLFLRQAKLMSKLPQAGAERKRVSNLKYVVLSSASHTVTMRAPA